MIKKGHIIHKFLHPAEYRKPKMADGGSIPDNYEGKSAEQVWNEWDAAQRSHFVSDHRSLFENRIEIPIVSLPNLDYLALPEIVRTQLDVHVSEGQYAKGGGLGRGGEKKHPHLRIDKGVKLPHGYKAEKGKDRSENYSSDKIRLDKGYRTHGGYETKRGKKGKQYKKGGDLWIQKAHLKKGKLRALAQKEGAINESGKIDVKWLEKKSHESGIVGKRARLALTLRGLKK